MNKKIVFFDIDGTLLDHDKKIPLSTKQAIEKLKQNGVYVAIATGRAPFMFEDIRKELGIESFVSFNGQYVVFEGETIYNNPLGQEELAMLYENARERNYPMVFMDEKYMRASEGDHPQITKSMDSLHFDYPEVDPDFFKVNTIYQALLFCEVNQEKPFIQNHGSLEFVRWHEYSCDVLPGGGSKAVGVKKLIEASGLHIDDSYSFGDAMNDMEMTSEVGTGVVMGNGAPQLKQIADYITDDVENDGIAKGLRRLGLI
ncbi:Cof-type HAD-IIB family hydrolase [Virgibacillus sp. NKC19-16]|uniref:Cof-type HAD-IIB family hydrolase n=1 Tax=Virgibacillus salidurans TaxID=2831673 RepID=UPI001F40CBDF|nr:Cof-type HAD-IIB family hydrolase [Virgibacillus sp. NKC19-16]UJL47797.1 Cof-type HAD-IIB family hydrolase [Virgibacillus sp. NKC19-16]